MFKLNGADRQNHSLPRRQRRSATKKFQGSEPSISSIFFFFFISLFLSSPTQFLRFWNSNFPLPLKSNCLLISHSNYLHLIIFSIHLYFPSPWNTFWVFSGFGCCAVLISLFVIPVAAIPMSSSPWATRLSRFHFLLNFSSD